MTGSPLNGSSHVTIGRHCELIMTDAHRVAVLRELTQQVAFQFWVERGRPFGSPEVDWYRAEVLLDRLASIWNLKGF